MAKYDKSHYYVDFSKHENLSEAQRIALERIQELYLPLERAAFLGEYRDMGLITSDEYETMTGIPYKFD